MTTTTDRSSCEYVVMMFSASKDGSTGESGRAGVGGWCRQPLEIVESSQQVTSALLECVALVSEMCEGEFVVVERHDRLAADLLEEGSLRERRGDFGLPVLGRSGEVATGGLVESGRAYGEQVLHICAAGGFRIEVFDDQRVDCVIQLGVRENLAREHKQHLATVLIQNFQFKSPNAARRQGDERGGTRPQGAHENPRALQKFAPAEFRSRDVSQWYGLCRHVSSS